MPQFDVHALEGGGGKAVFVCNLQDDLLSGLSTRVVAPLYDLDAVPRPLGELTPAVDVEGQTYRIAIMELAAIRRAELGPVRTNLAEARDDIVRALDRLFTGI